MKNKAIDFLHSIFDIRDGKEQEERIVENIKKNIAFRGASLWTLIFAIFIASIGLNINSIAIIIGAMLISPLMGPIVGLGFSLGTNDTVFLRKSIRNLSVATIISIVISTLYFYLSPISNIQSELLARTSPTIYDVLIAFFGGLAGIVGSTRIEKGNVIPGVAIATALMPPLCTAGYGLATGQPAFFFGALYLYVINCIFICLATFLGVEYLKLPSVVVDEGQKKKTKKIMVFVVLLMIIPATYLAYVFVKENNFNQNVDKYISETFINKGYAVIYKNIDYKSNPHKIELAFLSKHFTPSEIIDLQNSLSNFSLSNTELLIKQDNASLSEAEWNAAISSIKDESEKIKVLEAKLSSGFVGQGTANQILNEMQAINHKVTKVAIGNLSFAGEKTEEETASHLEDITKTVAIVYVSGDSDKLSEEDQQTLISWLKLRLQNKDLSTYFLSE